MIPLFLLTSWSTSEPLIVFPESMSSLGLRSLALDLFVSHFWTTIYLSIYFYTVGLFITGSFFKSLYKKTNAGLRGPALNNISSTNIITYF